MAAGRSLAFVLWMGNFGVCERKLVLGDAVWCGWGNGDVAVFSFWLAGEGNRWGRIRLTAELAVTAFAGIDGILTLRCFVHELVGCGTKLPLSYSARTTASGTWRHPRAREEQQSFVALTTIAIAMHNSFEEAVQNGGGCSLSLKDDFSQSVLAALSLLHSHP